MIGLMEKSPLEFSHIGGWTEQQTAGAFAFLAQHLSTGLIVDMLTEALQRDELDEVAECIAAMAKE